MWQTAQFRARIRMRSPGTGTLNFGGITFLNSNGINTTTQNPYIFRPGIIRAGQQPAFLAYLGTNDTAVTGNGANYQLGTNIALTKSFDQWNNFNTNGTFTAPFTGRYLFTGTICLLVSAAMTNGYLFLNATASLLSLGCIESWSSSGKCGDHHCKRLCDRSYDCGKHSHSINPIAKWRGNNAGLVASGGSGVLATFFSGEMLC